MKQKNYKLVIKPLITCVALLFFVTQLLIPQTTALAYFHNDKNIYIPPNADLNRYNLPSGGDYTIPILAICLAANIGYAFKITGYHIFGWENYRHYEISYDVNIDNLIISLAYYDEFGTPLLLKSEEIVISASTTFIRTNIYIKINYDSGKTCFIATVNNQFINFGENTYDVRVYANDNYYLPYSYCATKNNNLQYGNYYNTADFNVVPYSMSISTITILAYTNILNSYPTLNYADGYNDGLAMSNDFETMSWLQTIWIGLDTCLSIEILPNFKLWYLVGLPVSLSLLFFILKLIRGN